MNFRMKFHSFNLLLELNITNTPNCLAKIPFCHERAWSQNYVFVTKNVFFLVRQVYYEVLVYLLLGESNFSSFFHEKLNDTSQ